MWVSMFCLFHASQDVLHSKENSISVSNVAGVVTWSVICLMLIYYLLEFPKKIWRQLNWTPSISLLVLIPIIVRGQGLTHVIFLNTFFLSGFEDESDSTHAKQQMEVVRSEIPYYHGWMYAFLFQAKAMT